MISCLDSFSGSYEHKVTQLFQATKMNMAFSNSDADHSKSTRENLSHYDYTSSALKRRIAATVTYRNQARKELAPTVSPADIDALMAFSNAMILRGGYTNPDICESIVLASAIWILDQFNLQGNTEAIYPYLPEIDEQDSFSPLLHPQYDQELIYSVAKLIYFRNEKSYGAVDWTLPVLAFSKTQYPPRQAYDAVIALIDANAIADATAQYQRDVWKFYKLSLSAYAKLQYAEKKIADEIEQLEKKRIPQAALLLRNPQNIFTESNPIAEQLQVLHRKLERFQHLAWITEIGLVNSREKTARKCRDIIGNDLAEQLIQFEVDDPFESAFALHILLDTDSLIPWLYYGSICVTYTLVDQLPFYNDFAEKGNAQLCRATNRALYSHRFKGVRWEGLSDCLGEPVERTFGKNLSQMLYYNSHTLYPRVSDEMPRLDSFYADLALNDEKERLLYTLLIQLLGSRNNLQESLQSYRLSNSLKELQEAANIPETADTAQLEKAIAILQSSVQKLSQALYEEGRLKKNAALKCDELMRENQRLTRELADLRELVFLRQSDESAEMPVSEPIKFPIMTSGRIVSFGGHPAWITEMKKLLPNVLFCSPDVVPNKDIIRNADQVWVQTQYISHASFYRIVSSLSTQAQIRYFVSKSAQRCAEQLYLSQTN